MAKPDVARPDAAVAQLTAELIEVLDVRRIHFGVDLKEVPVVVQPEGGKASARDEADARYRDLVLAYEKDHGRHPVAKPEGQPGHDIDSFDAPGGKLVRRIEVKGLEQRWDGNAYVELSWRQFHDAADEVGEGFDYWLYVVELVTPGSNRVIPICNPARRAGKFEFRGGTWRILGETEFVKKEMVAEVRRQIRTYARFKKLTDEWVELALRIARRRK